MVDENDYDGMKYDISNVEKWVSDWQLKINVGKCELLHIGSTNNNFQYELNGLIIPTSDKCRDLGITVSDDLKFTSHCQKIARNAHYRRRQFQQSFAYKDRKFQVEILIQQDYR